MYKGMSSIRVGQLHALHTTCIRVVPSAVHLVLKWLHISPAFNARCPRLESTCTLCEHACQYNPDDFGVH